MCVRLLSWLIAFSLLANFAAAEKLEQIRVSGDKTHFVGSVSGRRFVVWGVNYDHDTQGRLLDEYWMDEWDTVVEDFREIKELGANCVRIHLQFGKFMDAKHQPNDKALQTLKKLVKLAEDVGLYLDVTGLACYHKSNIPGWYDKLSEKDRWASQAIFWQAVAGTCKDSPAIFCYDLMNEPILPGKEPATEWLAGEFGGKHFVQRLTLDLQERTREQVAAEWVSTLTSAIRKHDEHHMITVGVIPWVFVFGGGKPLFHSAHVGKELDFVAVHFYPKKGEVGKALKALQAYEVGKPLVIEETFPLSCSEDELVEFMTGSASIADGWISFYWGTPANELLAKDKKTIAEAITASWLNRFRKLRHNTKLFMPESPSKSSSLLLSERKVQNHARVVKCGQFPNRVHVVETFETDIEKRWWLRGVPELKNVPRSFSDSVPNRRAMRAAETLNFDRKMGDRKTKVKGVIFNPVPGPPMGKDTRLSFQYWIDGSDSLKVQIYSLSNAYHRYLMLTDLPQRKWGFATVDMTQARRPDGSGGPLAENERIDDIQFYVDSAAELLIDNIILFDKSANDEKRPFPRRTMFTGWFDTGQQGKEWPGDFDIVLNEKPRTWDSAKSIVNESTGKPWLRIQLRGMRRLSHETHAYFRYRLDGDPSLRVALVNSKNGQRFEASVERPVIGTWSDSTIRFAIPKDTAVERMLVDEIQFDLQPDSELLIDDLLIYEPG